MRLSIRTLDGVVVVGITGVVDSDSVGHLFDALVQCIAKGSGKLIVDLSGLHGMAPEGARGLLIAAKLASSMQGEMRICGAKPSIVSRLQGMGVSHLPQTDPDVESSLIALSRSTVVPVQFPEGSRRSPTAKM